MRMLDFWLMVSLGFLGSFGHCVGMCGPLTVAFSLSTEDPTPLNPEAQPPLITPVQRWRQIRFHLLLNVGRLVSYALVGAVIGGLGSVLVAGGQVAGVGSDLRRVMAIVTGCLLIVMGLAQVSPGWLPRLPVFHPLAQGALHDALSRAMVRLSLRSHWWTPALLGLAWGLIPCGFLYAAQLRAAATSQLWGGMMTMVAFGLGTLPTMLGVGISAAWMSQDRRSQLFRLGGWLTLLIGGLILTRTGDAMTDYSGHLALLALMMALVARPLSRFWAGPLRHRRLLGVGAFILAAMHTLHMLEHSWGWNLQAPLFMRPQHQWGLVAGGIALGLMMPAVVTSSNGAQRALGKVWRKVHLLAVPALVLCGLHCILIGSHYLGELTWTAAGLMHTGILVSAILVVLGVRSQWVWRWLALEKDYVPPSKTP